MTSDDIGAADDQPGHPFDGVDPTDVELPVLDASEPAAIDDASFTLGDEPGGAADDGADPADDLDELDEDSGLVLDPVDLDVDDTEPDDSEIDLDDREIDLGLDSDADADADADPGLDSDAGLDGTPDTPGTAGTVGTIPLADWAADAMPGGVTHDEVVAMVERLGLDPTDLGPREVVHVLERLGATAWMEHGSVDSLAELLARGGRCQLVDGSDRFDVIGVDDRSDELVVRDTASGRVVNIALEAFEDAWSASAFAQLTQAGDDPVVLISAHVTAAVPIVRDTTPR